MSRYAALSILLVAMLAYAMPGSSAQWGPITHSRSIDDIKAEVETKLDLGNPDVEQR